MIAVDGTFRDGVVTLSAPPDWAEGAQVRVELVSDYPGVGIHEEDWPRDPAGIAELLAKIDAIGPGMTAEEEATWRATLDEEKARKLDDWERECREVGTYFP